MAGWDCEDKRRINIDGKRGRYEVNHCVAYDDQGRERYRYQLRLLSDNTIRTFYNRESLYHAIAREEDHLMKAWQEYPVILSLDEMLDTRE